MSGYDVSDCDDLVVVNTQKKALHQSKHTEHALFSASKKKASGQATSLVMEFRANEGSSSLSSSREERQMPWGIRKIKTATFRHLVTIRMPKELICDRTSVQSGNKEFAVNASRGMTLPEKFATLEEAIAAQTEFIDELEDQELAEELRRYPTWANNPHLRLVCL